jgi:hypothetical protein
MVLTLYNQFRGASSSLLPTSQVHGTPLLAKDFLYTCHALCAPFSMMAALGRDIVRTNVFGSLAMVLLILLGGFALKRPDVVSYSSSTGGIIS